VAADGSGNFVVIWAGFGQGRDWDIFGQRFSSSGAPLGPEFRVNTYAPFDQGAPDVAVDGTGNVVAVWGSGGDIFGQRYAASGTPLGPEFRVNTYTQSQFGPSVAIDPSGNFVVVWTSLPATVFNIYGQRYAAAGAPLGPEFAVTSSMTDHQVDPCIATDAAANFVVTWRDENGGDYRVLGQRYAASGGTLGQPFIVNTYSTGYQDHPSVAADGSGRFIVVWESAAQDGSADGVFGQRFGAIVPVELMRFQVE
jgi:hypothetical protein